MFSPRVLRVLPKFPDYSKPARLRRFFSHSVKPLAYEVHEPCQSQIHKLESPIFFLHGLFGSKSNYRSVGKVLAQELGRHVYALDLRNHGESPHHLRHDYLSLAEDVIDFIHEGRFNEPTIIGHSMGAKTAMAVALRSSDLVADIVAVDNSPVSHILDEDFAGYIRGMKKIEDAKVTRKSQADKILEEYEKSPLVRQFLLGNLYRQESDGTHKFRVPLDILGRTWQSMGEFPYDNPNETEFDKPALFIRGTRSNYITDDDFLPISQFFPNFSLVDIDAGHWLISEQPKLFTQAVVKFLQKRK